MNKKINKVIKYVRNKTRALSKWSISRINKDEQTIRKGYFNNR